MAKGLAQRAAEKKRRLPSKPLTWVGKFWPKGIDKKEFSKDSIDLLATPISKNADNGQILLFWLCL